MDYCGFCSLTGCITLPTKQSVGGGGGGFLSDME